MGFSPFDGFSGLMFNIVPVIVMIGFVFVFGFILIQIIQSIRQWNRNNDSPVLTVDATIVTKHTIVTDHHHDAGNNAISHSTYTTHYITFQVESGDRMEFQVKREEYGLLAENDTGKLTFQGTRYLGFRRTR